MPGQRYISRDSKNKNILPAAFDSPVTCKGDKVTVAADIGSWTGVIIASVDGKMMRFSAHPSAPVSRYLVDLVVEWTVRVFQQWVNNCLSEPTFRCSPTWIHDNLGLNHFES